MQSVLRYVVKVASTVIFVSFLGLNIQVVVPQQCEELTRSHFTDFEIPCPDMNDECTWFRIENGSQVSVESRFLNLSDNNLELQRNDRYGYGLFNVSTSHSDSFCYKVCPVDTEYICNNCSDIIIDNKTNPPEIELCAGENISITIVAPPIFNISEDYWGASLRLNESNLDCNSKCCPIGDVRVSSVVYQCTNMEEADGGLYFGHNLISCAGISLEWCTQGVLINITNCSNGRNDSSLTATVVQTSSYSIYRNTSTESSSIRSTPATPMELTSSVTMKTTTLLVSTTSSTSSVTMTTATIMVSTTSSIPTNSSNGRQNTGLIIGIASAGSVIGIPIVIAILIIIGYVVYNRFRWEDYDVQTRECTDPGRNVQSSVTSVASLDESNV